MIERCWCSCGLSFDSPESQIVHQSRQNNKPNHNLTRVKPGASDPRNLMFTIWAVTQATTDAGASILIHASLHVHLSEVIYDHQEPIDQLLERREYERRAVLETVFPYLLNAQSKSPYPLTKIQLLASLENEPALEDVKDEDLIEAVNEWRFRHA